MFTRFDPVNICVWSVNICVWGFLNLGRTLVLTCIYVNRLRESEGDIHVVYPRTLREGVGVCGCWLWLRLGWGGWLVRVCAYRAWVCVGVQVCMRGWRRNRLVEGARRRFAVGVGVWRCLWRGRGSDGAVRGKERPFVFVEATMARLDKLYTHPAIMRTYGKFEGIRRSRYDCSRYCQNHQAIMGGDISKVASGRARGYKGS